MKALKQWFTSLQPRERWMVLAGGIMVLIAVIYSVLTPFYRSITAQSARLDAKRADLAWMVDNAGNLQALNASQPLPLAGGPGNESLIVLVDRTAREVGLGSNVTGQTPAGPNGIRVRLEGAAFDSLALWLNSLTVGYNIKISSANVNRSGQPGLVNASIELTR